MKKQILNYKNREFFFSEEDETLYKSTRTGFKQFSWRNLTQAIQKQLDRLKQ